MWPGVVVTGEGTGVMVSRYPPLQHTREDMGDRRARVDVAPGGSNTLMSKGAGLRQGFIPHIVH